MCVRGVVSVSVRGLCVRGVVSVIECEGVVSERGCECD